MLFDGAVAATVAETVSSTDHQPTETAKAQTTDDAALKTGDAATPLAATSDQRQEVVFIDGKVTNRQQLIDSIKPGVEVVTLDSSKDGLQQIADYLESRSGLDAIHILSHGDVGKISLGNSWLDSAALETQSGLLAEIGQSLARNGDILLYGCEVGAGEAGLDFIGRLANVTKADVAASADLTGASSLGGNWILEARHGKVETKGLEGLSSYNSLLAIPADEYFDDNPTQEIRGTNTFVLDGFRYTVTGPAGTAYDHYLNNVQYAPAGEGLALGGPTDNYLRFDTNGEGATSITIEVADGSAFRLMSLSFFVEDATSSGGPSGSFTITPAGGSALTYSTDTTYQDVDFSNNTGFYNITSITFSSLPGEMIYLDIDDLNVDAPITNTAPSVANAIPNQNATEDAAFNFQFAANTFSDVDADTLTYSAQLAGGGALPAWLSFNAATRTFSGTPTNANVGTLSIDVIANDGNGGTVTDTFNIIVVDNTNDAPTITATGNNPTYTENGSAVDLFNSVSINTIEAGQSITRMTLSVTNLADGSDELLRIDGTDIALLNGNSGTTASNGISYSVSVFSGTATIALSSAGGLSAATAQTVVDGMAYRNSSDAPSTATRVITLTSIRDSGGTANGGVDTTVTSISASVSVVAVNDAPIVISSGGASTFTEGGGGTVIDSGLTLSDPDNATLASTRITIAGNFQSGDVLSFSNDDSSMGNIVATYNAGTGVMTLTSAGATATLAQWQAALRSVTYSNGSDAPSTANRTISFVANDGQNDSTAATKIVSVTAVNDAPQITAPVSIGVTEDMPGAITGISFSDVDAGSANVTVTLTIGSGSLSAIGNGSVTVGGTSSALTLTGSIANINSFIAGSNLSFTTAANATADVTLTVSINDGGNTGNGGAQSANETITLQVTAVNDAPTITAPGSIAITEDIPGALTGISFSDVDAGSGTVTVTFSVPSGTLNATSGNGVSIGGTSSELTLTGSLADINAFIAASGVSFTTASNATANVTLTVMIDDGGNTGSGGAQTDTTNVTLTVTAVNDAPVNTVPSSQTMLQDGTLVFSTGNGNALSIADVDVGGGTMRVTLTASNGLLTLGSLSGVSFLVGNGTGDGTMVFEGNLSAINNALAGLSFAPTGGYYGPAAVQITTDDLGQSGSGGGQTDTDTILINVAQTNPLITGVASSSPDGAYKVGDTVNITVTFDQAVNVSGGTPTLLLETGAIDRNAVYVGGSGTDTLTFAYVVQAGDQSTDLDYAGSAALSLNGASIASVSLGNPAFTTLPAPGAADSLGANTALVIDGVAPVVSSVSVPANGTYAAGQNLDFTVNFSESVTVDTSGGTPRLAVTLDTGGTVYANYVSGSGTSALVFRFTVASGQADANGITVGSAIQDNGGSIRDAAGNVATIALNNVGATNGVLVDAADPAIVNVAVPPAGSYAAGSVLTFTVNLSEAVTVDTSGGTPQLQLDIGGRSVQADYVSGSGTSALVFRYTVQAGDTDSDGITISALSSNGSMLQDSSGNALSPNLVGVGNTAGVLIDTTPPAASSIIRVDASPTGASSVSYTVTFSENVTGVDASDFSLLATGSASGTIASVTQLNGQTYVVMVNGITGSGSLGLNLRAGSTGIADSAGNAIMGGLVGQAYAIDRPLPAVSSVAVPANGTYVAGQHLDFTVNFSESIIVDNSGGAPRIAVTLDTGGTVYASYVSGSGSNALVFRLTIAEGQLDSNGIDLGDSIQLNGATLKDASGTNASTTLSGVAATGGVRVDAQDPTASIAPLGASPTSAETVSFLVSFDESVTGVDAGDFNLLSSGTVRGTLQSVVQIDARTYQVTVTGVSGSGSLQIMLNASGSGISDIAGNRLGSNVISGGYEIIQPKPQPEGDPEFRANPPPVAPVEPTPLPQVVVPVAPPPSATTSPLLPPPLFEVPTLGSGIPTLGNIFINQGAMAPSFIAQVFANSADAGGDGSGAGFLGFGGGDAGIFGSSSLSSIFGKEVLQETEEQNIFKQRGNGGEGAVFGAPPLSQQLHQLHEGEQRQIRELAMALGQIHLNGPQA
ncbi:DUF4347 domain-containing protein [Pseudomonas sp. PDM16]|uniref:DUF4347 domain-containing protein n=1 Tax=Pseudomonas sp. PDM16 TaxID=2769292 RepID=UPI001CE1D5A4|nr:DUF4347 domain-containing protein [Pseudomonas sp. PDM16]